MNARFENYLSALKPKQRELVREGVAQYLMGEGEMTSIYNAADAYQLMRFLSTKDVEFGYIIIMRKYRVIDTRKISEGGLTQTCIDGRIVFRELLMQNATSYILVHNHPSGSLNPSREDDELTKRINEASDIVGIKLIDHIIIGNGNYYSYKEQGRL